MSMENFAPLMFAGLIVIMLIGFPVAFSLSALGLLCGFVAIEMGWFSPAFMANLPHNVFGILSNDLLLAIPFFTLMGAILEKCGLAEDMLDSMGQLFGPVRGGLGYSVIIVGFILGAVTGTVAGQVIAMAMISLPVMMRYGYNMRYSTGVLAASGTITQLVPPSLVLVVLADQLGRSVGDMYKGAVLPGLILGGLYVGWVLLNTLFRPHLVPALPPEARTLRGWGLARRVVVTMLPPLVLIFLVLGTIFIGWATPTEGGAMGAVGALALAFSKGKLNRKMLTESLHSTAKIASFVIFILIGSSVFSLVFRGVNGDLWVEHLLLDLPGGALGFLIFVNILVFFLAFFLDFFEISFIILPLLAPVADKLGIDLVWFGILMGVNMQTSFMHPPFGFALFYLRSVAPPEIRTSDIYWGAVPFVVIQVIMVVLIITFPSLVTMGLDRPMHTGQPAPVQLLMPLNNKPGSINRDDAADLFRQLQPSGQ